MRLTTLATTAAVMAVLIWMVAVTSRPGGLYADVGAAAGSQATPTH